MQNMRIGVKMSMLPVGVKPSRPDRCPSWKIQTIAPNVAVRLRTLSSSALTGTRRLPVIRNSSTNVATAISASVHGRTARTDAFVSTSVADSPATENANGAAVARMSRTSRSPAAECGSTLGTTDSQVPAVPRTGMSWSTGASSTTCTPASCRACTKASAWSRSTSATRPRPSRSSSDSPPRTRRSSRRCSRRPSGGVGSRPSRDGPGRGRAGSCGGPVRRPPGLLAARPRAGR